MSGPAGFVVVDASIACKWVLNEPGTPQARALLETWVTARLQPGAPSWFACEVANVVYRHARVGTITLTGAKAALNAVLGIVTLRDTPGSEAIRAMEIASIARQQTPYDACYLALAEREGCEYWTDDDRFARATAPYFAQVRHLGGK